MTVPPPVEGKQMSEADLEVISLHKQIKRVYIALDIYDEVNAKVVLLLKELAERKLDPSTPPITTSDS